MRCMGSSEISISKFWDLGRGVGSIRGAFCNRGMDYVLLLVALSLGWLTGTAGVLRLANVTSAVRGLEALGLQSYSKGFPMGPFVSGAVCSGPLLCIYGLKVICVGAQIKGPRTGGPWEDSRTYTQGTCPGFP